MWEAGSVGTHDNDGQYVLGNYPNIWTDLLLSICAPMREIANGYFGSRAPLRRASSRNPSAMICSTDASPAAHATGFPAYV